MDSNTKLTKLIVCIRHGTRLPLLHNDQNSLDLKIEGGENEGLTKKGQEEICLLGNRIKTKYINFFNSIDIKNDSRIYTTNLSRTIISGSLFLMGIIKENKQIEYYKLNEALEFLQKYDLNMKLLEHDILLRGMCGELSKKMHERNMKSFIKWHEQKLHYDKFVPYLPLLETLHPRLKEKMTYREIIEICILK